MLPQLPGSLRIKAAYMCIGVALLIVAILNTYPLIVSQNSIVSAKRDRLISDATFIAGTIAARGMLGVTDVAHVMEAHNVVENRRVVITDERAVAVFDSSIVDNAVSKYVLLPEVCSATAGQNHFTARVVGNALESRVATPIMSSERVLGTVYIFESDIEQASVLSGMRFTMMWLSMLVCAILILLTLIITGFINKRLSKLMLAIHKIRDGEYGSSVPLEGHDELTEVLDEFNKMSVRLMSVEEARRTFVSDASHELRTPLSAIRLLTDSVLQTPDIDIATAREFLEDIGTEIDRLSRIAEKLLVLTRLDAGTVPGLVPVSLTEISAKVLASLKLIAEESGIELKGELEENCWIEGDPDGVHQVVSNLVDNAIKYNERGGFVKVFLFTRENVCTLIVDDNGIGIPADSYDKIFDRFYRVDKARSRTGKGGSGLGLAIVKEHVESYGGTITVGASTYGGTRFTVTFPRGKAQPSKK